MLSLLPQPGGWPPAGSSDFPADGGARAATGPIATLGALDRSGALSLATLDDELAPVPSTDGTLPASMGPATPRPPPPARSRHEPVDPFAPPELVSAGAPDGVPQALAPAPPGSPVLAAAPPRISDAPPSVVAVAARRVGSQLTAWIPVLGSARVRLVAGVALAIALGFVPAHLVAGMRERSAFAAIDAKVTAVQSTADTPDSYAALDGFRAEQLDAKYSARRSIAVTSLLVWAAAGAALAYGWFSLFGSGSAAPAAPRPAPVSPGGARDSLGG